MVIIVWRRVGERGGKGRKGGVIEEEGGGGFEEEEGFVRASGRGTTFDIRWGWCGGGGAGEGDGG